MRPPATASKAEWRRWATTLPPVPVDLCHRVSAHLTEMLRDREGAVLAYAALPDEVPVDGLDRTGALVLPRLGSDAAMTIHVDDGRRERHPHGMEQPPAGLAAVDPATVAAVLVPGRVFDRDGYRLGRGGGHYDRLLPQLARGTSVIGVTIEDRIVERLPREPHDRPMTHLATEQGVFSTE